MKAYPKKFRFAIWGFGVTGRALAKVLSERGYIVTVFEDRPESEFSEHEKLISDLKSKGVEFFFHDQASFTETLKKDFEVLAPSPGIAVPEYVQHICQEAHVQIVSEIEIASRLVPGHLIAVSGTDGKSTTATWIHHILSTAGLPAHLAGNIGVPFIELAGKTKPDHWLVIETSSYQLEYVRLFKPFIAILLNIAEDHLTRHGSLKNYIRVKGKMFERQKSEDYAILNFDDPACLQAYNQSTSTIRGFSLAGPLPKGAWRENETLMLDTDAGPIELVRTSELSVIGEHNQYNALASAIACHLAGCPLDAIRESLKTFKGLPHRLEPIAEIDGVLWVNDSKATNVHSAISALKCFERPVILLLGGFDKGLDISELIPHIQMRTKHVVLMGETRNRFKKALKDADYDKITVRKTLAEACAAAESIAEPGDVVLLSPASSSFDQFRDYIERGEAFRKWIEKKIAQKER